MKWGGTNKQGEERMNKVFGKLFNSKATYYLLTIAALGLLLSDSFKWHPLPLCR